MTPSLLALASSFTSPAFDTAPGPDELAASVAVLDFLSTGTAESGITLTWGRSGYAAVGETGAMRTAHCMAPDDERYAGVVAALDTSFGIRAVTGTLQYETSEAHGHDGRATFEASAAPAAPSTAATSLCLVLDDMIPVAVTAVHFESIGQHAARYTATVFPVGPRS